MHSWRASPIVLPEHEDIPRNARRSAANRMSEQFYVLLGEETVGPISKEELFSMRSDRRMTDKTLICRVGDSEWRPMGELFPSTESVRPPPPPPVPSVPSKRSQKDRELLHEYLVMVFAPQKESAYVRPSITDALADAIPALGNFLGRRKGVVAGTTVADSKSENTKREPRSTTCPDLE